MSAQQIDAIDSVEYRVFCKVLAARIVSELVNYLKIKPLEGKNYE